MEIQRAYEKHDKIFLKETQLMFDKLLILRGGGLALTSELT